MLVNCPDTLLMCSIDAVYTADTLPACSIDAAYTSNTLPMWIIDHGDWDFLQDRLPIHCPCAVQTTVGCQKIGPPVFLK